jgi:hypothetical protein
MVGTGLEIILWIAFAIVGLALGAIFLALLLGIVIATIRTYKEMKGEKDE